MAALGMVGQKTWAQTASPARGELVVLAAGSLRRAMTELAAAFEQAAPGQRVRLVFGASGLLLERIRYGERADVFASANMEHAQALVADGEARDVRSFARNELCALVAPGLAVDSQSLVEKMLDARIKLGTSTPKSDPSGDYAWTMFERIEQQGHAGAFRTLSGKALQLTGGPASPPPPADRNVYAALVADGQADIFITYCTNARQALSEQPRLQVVAVPAAFNVSASYGIAVNKRAPPSADAFVDFVLGAAGQALLVRQGFSPP
ncbi:MAG TPA: molybdate ABC transporter substrate-binding protein [Rubrivivax sp.]